ncbi:TPA: leucine-rich repeat domain-containing protein, partial [Elizabethkingia anophelis]
KKLILRNNKITIIPPEIEKLTRLETLDLSGNSIVNFYSKICSLKNLKILNLNNNRIKTIPLQIKNLTKIISLHLSNNNLSLLPNQIYELSNLRELDISKNNIEAIDDNISKLSKIQKIWINGLPLKKFPDQEFFPKTLKCLYAYSNITTNNTDSNYYKLSKIKGNSLNAFKLYKNNSNTEINMTDKKQIKNKIFISYSHKDEIWLSKLKVHLKVLSHHLNIDIDVWDDKRLITGDNWKKEIIYALNSSGIAIMLVSADFLASEFINREEIPNILSNSKNQGTKILPIIVKPCMFNKSKLSEYQALNSPTTPLSKLTENDVEEYLVKLSEEIYALLN